MGSTGTTEEPLFEWDDDVALLLDGRASDFLGADAGWLVLRNRARVLESVQTVAEDSALIHPSAVIINSYIGEGARVYENVAIRDSYIGAGVVVGHCSEVVRSVVLSGCSIPRFDYVGSSVLGQRVRLGGCVALASRRWDNEPVRPDATDAVATWPKLGSLVGADTVVGWGAHINPGCVVGRRCLVGPHVDLRTDVSAGVLVSVVQRQEASPLRFMTRTGA